MARIISLLLVASWLSACTGLKLAYNNGEHLSVWWLNSYVDLDKAQARQVRDALRDLQEAQRKEVLPLYADWLEQAQALAVQDMAPEQVCAMGGQVRSYVAALLFSTEAAATSLAQSLSPAQISHLEHKYADNSTDYRKDWLTLGPAELNDKRFDKALERAEMVYGRIDKAQKALIRQQVEQSRFDPQRVQTERLRRQADTVQTLRQLANLPNTADARVSIHSLMERSLHSPSASYRQYADALAQQDCQGIATVHNSTTPQQRAAAVRWLAGYAKTLRELASSG